MRLFLNTCGVVIIIFSLVWFATHNAQTVSVQIYPSKAFELPVWSLIFAPFLVGVVIGNLLDVIQRLKLHREVKKLRQACQNVTARK